MKTLRPYQSAAIKALFNWLYTPGTGNPLVVAPVGSGKSLMIAEFIRQVHEEFPRTRIVVLTHVKELLQQNAEELRGQYPDCDFGFYCASLDQKRLHNDVTFASIQSVFNKIDGFNRCPELIIVDECHLISHNGATQYRKFFDSVHAINPNVKILGFTGTPFRADTGRLDEGKGKLFDGVCYEIGMDYMIEQGYWAKPVTPDMAVKMDVTGVTVRGGDYVLSELEERVNTAELREACVRELIEKGMGRKKWLVFTAAVQHCTDVYNDLKDLGISVGMVTGETPKAERDATIDQFRRGELQCLVNVAVLTTGFNVPDVDLLAFMRPTRSPVLYIQMTGRGVRPIYAPGFNLDEKEQRIAAIAASTKPDCMLLDFGGVVAALGPIDKVNIRKKNKEKDEDAPKGQPIVKICPSCGAACAAAQRYCYACSYCFIVLDDTPAENAVVSVDEPPRWVNVLNWNRRVNQKDPEKPATMLVTYFCEMERFYDTVCLNHPKGSFPHDKARAWHKTFTAYPMPESVLDGVNSKIYQMPSRLKVKREGKFWRVIEYDFTRQEKEEIIPIRDEDFEIAF